MYSKNEEEIFKILNSNIDGLDSKETEKRLKDYGQNIILNKKKKVWILRFLKQFNDTMIIILLVVALLLYFYGCFYSHEYTDTIVILFVVFINAIVGFIQEEKATLVLKDLKKYETSTCKVKRDDKIIVINTKELVPGDIIYLESGETVPADIRILSCENLKVDESALTGESVPVQKSSDVLKNNLILQEQKNMLFLGTSITNGKSTGIVVSTGKNTEIGKIALSLNEIDRIETPLQLKIKELSKKITFIVFIILIFIFILALINKYTILEIIMLCSSLAVAAIPEGLPTVITITLSVGISNLAKKKTVVKQMQAVETLGAIDIICSDKTGTITQNKMTVKKIFYDGKLENIGEINQIAPDLQELIYISMMCNDTKVGADNKLTGDPTETALIDMGFTLDFQPSIFEEMPRAKEIPFDSDRKLMTTVNKRDGKYYVFTKGGIDELLKRCNKYLINGEVKEDLNNYIPEIKKNNEDMASDALRVLAMAYKILDHEPTDDEMKNMESDLIYVGMVGMIDPPREEVKVAVEKCKSAGIKTVMITGDHKSTAVAIAKDLGILCEGDKAITGSELEEMSDEELIKNVRHYAVYARVSPEHKVRIVKAWQANGEIVAMTGDGVNDAPALKTADIGCAMGIVGTDVSKEAADVILTDDNFATIVSSVEEGRRIYDNILKAIQFLLSSNVGEIIVLFVAILIAPLLSSKYGIDINYITPLLPVQILWINLVTDSLPALALAVDPAERDIMKRKPAKKQKGIFTKGMTWRIVYQGFMIGFITLAAFIIGIATPDEKLPDMIEIEGKYYNVQEVDNVEQKIADGAKLLDKQQVKVEIGQAMAFIVLALSELVHVFNIRNNKKSIFKTGIGGNNWLFGAIAIAAALVFVILLIPELRHVFSIPVLPKSNIIETVCLVLAPIVIVEIFKLFKNKYCKR